MNALERAEYFKNQVTANLVINCGLNGLIAFFFYRARNVIPLAEIAIDIQITVAIIGFFVSWIAISAARKKLKTMPVELSMASTGGGHRSAAQHRFLTNGALRSLVIMLVLMGFYGGLFLTGVLALLAPGGVSNWVYVLFKTLYTGGCAACAAVLAIGSVYRE